MTESNKKIYPARFVIDEYFINDLIKEDKLKVEIISRLSHIHVNSEHYSFTHNQIFDESFKNAIADKEIRGPGLIGAMHPIKCPDFLKDENIFESKIIRHCINLASKKPYRIIILTSEKQAKKYLANEHYNKDENIKNAILVVFGSNAFNLIDVISKI